MILKKKTHFENKDTIKAANKERGICFHKQKQNSD